MTGCFNPNFTQPKLFHNIPATCFLRSLQCMFSAINFLIRSLNNHHHGIASESVVIKTSLKNFEAIVYKKCNRKHFKGSILVVNGFSVHGHKDQRMVQLAKSIAHIGFRVIAVAFDDLNNLKIHPRTVTEMSAVIIAVACDKYLCAQSKVAFLAPSYSAGMMLNACADREAAPFVSSVCAIGTLSNIEKSLSFLLNHNDIDDYGRNILLYNFLPYTAYRSEGILKIIKTAIDDNGFKRPQPLLPEVLKNSEEADALLWQKFEQDISFRKNLLEEAFQLIPEKEQWISAFDIYAKAKQIHAPVIFIHGKNDVVIPPSESESLHRHLISEGKKSYLCITSMLDHGDIQKNISMLFEVIALTKAFGRFFRNASVEE